MTYGIESLRKMQFGREATAGTPVAATEIWRGPAVMIEDQRDVVFPTEHVGDLRPYDRSYCPKLGAGFGLPSTEFTFEQGAHILEGGIDAESPTQDGAGDDYIREYVLGASGNAPKPYTWESGDNVDSGEMEYGFVSEFGLSGEVDKAIMLSQAIWQGRQYTDTAFTGSLSPISVEEMLFNSAAFTIDDVGDGFGTTAIAAGTILGFDLSVKTGVMWVRGNNGQLYPVASKVVSPEAKLTLYMEHDDVAVAERAKMRLQTARAVEMTVAGSAFGTGGTTYANKTFIMQAVGKYIPGSWAQLGATDGDNTVRVDLQLKYNATVAQMLKFIHVVDRATL